MYDSDTLAQDSSAAQKVPERLSLDSPLCYFLSLYSHVCLFTAGAEAAAASLHAAQDSGPDAGLPGRHHHHDLHAAQGDTHT